jgi:hypothetical protein
MLQLLVHNGLECGKELSWAEVRNNPGALPEDLTKLLTLGGLCIVMYCHNNSQC